MLYVVRDMTPSDLRVLAIRVETEHPTPDLTALVFLAAFGYEAEPGNAPDPLTSIDDAARLVPEGWRVFLIDEDIDGEWCCILLSPDEDNNQEANAPTEPRARTAAALRALAAGMEP